MLLVIDNHSTRFDEEFLDLCLQNHIHVLLLPPNLTHLLQPADVSVFGPFKLAVHAACLAVTGRAVAIGKHNVAAIVYPSWLAAVCPQNIKNGFRKTVIWPYDRLAIPDSELTLAASVAPVAVEAGKEEARLVHVPSYGQFLGAPRLSEPKKAVPGKVTRAIMLTAATMVQKVKAKAEARRRKQTANRRARRRRRARRQPLRRGRPKPLGKAPRAAARARPLPRRASGKGTRQTTRRRRRLAPRTRSQILTTSSALSRTVCAFVRACAVLPCLNGLSLSRTSLCCFCLRCQGGSWLLCWRMRFRALALPSASLSRPWSTRTRCAGVLLFGTTSWARGLWFPLRQRSCG